MYPLERVKNDLTDTSVVESAPGKLEGRQAVMGVVYRRRSIEYKKQPEGCFYVAYLDVCSI